MRYVLGVDGGATKTLAAVADENGEVRGLGRSGGSNFQSAGRAGAREELRKAIGQALGEAGVSRVQAACYGIAGADRDKDFEYIHEILKPINPAEHYVLLNDTLLALRAGTKDGVGVALVGGTGSNCIGMNGRGELRKACGLGPITGDKANAQALVEDAIIAALKGMDGRGPRTELEPALARAFGVEHLEDIIEFGYHDSLRQVDPAKFAPLVFETAARGDTVARQVLRSHGQAMAEAARAVLRGLFDPSEEVILALGGSVLQKGQDPTIIDTVREEVEKEFPHLKMIVLADEPIVGAVLRGLDELHRTTEHGCGDAVRRSIAERLAGK